MASPEPDTRNISYFFRRYLHEVAESVIGLAVISYFRKDLKIRVMDLFKMSTVIGMVTLFLEEFNQDLGTNVKQGMSFTVGSSLLGSFGA